MTALKLSPSIQRLLPALVILAAGWWIYLPSLHGGFLWDDDRALPGNPLLHDHAWLWKIWFAPGSLKEYYPLEETVQRAQWHLWGADTLGYHVTNVVLHLLSALLVWRLLAKFGLRLAWLGGLIFAVHPIQVESVAWIVELKNTLSLPPFLLALCAWIDYEERRQPADYGRALGWFLIAMLCKISMVLFPALMLLYAWWKRNRIGWDDLKAAAPFAVISVVLGFLNVAGRSWFEQTHGQTLLVPTEGPLSRLALVGLSTSFGLWNCFWPAGLLPVYPKWPVDPPSLLQFLPLLVWIGAGFLFWRKRSGWGRHAILGLGFFLLLLAPSPGFLPAPNMGFAWVMDHFFYIPIIGLIGLVVAGLEQIGAALKPSARPWGIALVAAAVLLLTRESRAQAALYVDHQTLWTYTLERNPNAWPAINDLGDDLMDDRRVPEALAYYQRALQIYPENPDVLNNLGNALARSGHFPEALQQYQKSLVFEPDAVNTHIDIGNVLLQTGQFDDAIANYHLALDFDPNNAKARYNLGNALQQQGHFPEAVEQYGLALNIDPGNEAIWTNMGVALQQMGLVSQAVDHYQRALQIDPQSADAHASLGSVLEQLGKIPEAVAQYKLALQIDPGLTDVRNNLKNLQEAPKGTPAAK